MTEPNLKVHQGKADDIAFIKEETIKIMEQFKTLNESLSIVESLQKSFSSLQELVSIHDEAIKEVLKSTSYRNDSSSALTKRVESLENLLFDMVSKSASPEEKVRMIKGFFENEEA